MTSTPLPADALALAGVFGTDGNDTLNGTADADNLFGLGGDDTLNGRGGNDVLFAGTGNDTLAGGTGDDTLLGEDGDDRFVWKAGDGNDAIEGGSGTDRVELTGDGTAEAFDVVSNGARVYVATTNGGVTSSLDIADVEQLVIRGGGGNDTMSATGNLAALTQITFDGGAGNDTIRGGNGADLLLGGGGNDFVDGNQGNDTADLGSGNDVFGWDPGDGNDVVEGGTGTDTLQFNGSNIGETIGVSANGDHAVFTRNIAAITTDLHGMENIHLRALGGADAITVGDLRGTDVNQVRVDLAAFDGSDDTAADTVTVALTGGDDVHAFTVAASGPAVVNALGAQVIVENQGVGDRLLIDGGAGIDTVTASGSLGDDVIAVTADGANVAVTSPGGPLVGTTNVEQLHVAGGAGHDTLAAVGNLAALTQLTLDGGSGDDTVRGGNGADTLLGGSGNDFVDGNQGNDSVNLGAGDDVFGWDPGDGSDIVNGSSGNDTLQFNASNAGETLDLSAGAGHAILTRNIGAVTMDLDNVEAVNLRTLGSADTITVHDLRGTDVKQVNIDLAGSLGGGDGANDVVTIEGSSRADKITLSLDNGALVVDGLAAQVVVSNFEIGDTIRILGLGGDDTIDASTLPVGASIVLDGGDGDDVLLGGAGDDVLIGGPGTDLLDGGLGDNVLIPDSAMLVALEPGGSAAPELAAAH